MQLTLVNGRFTAEESKVLFNKLVKAKKDFYRDRINVPNQSEEIISHSQSRIEELEAYVKRALSIIGNYEHVALNAKLSIEFCPDYHNQ